LELDELLELVVELLVCCPPELDDPEEEGAAELPELEALFPPVGEPYSESPESELELLSPCGSSCPLLEFVEAGESFVVVGEVYCEPDSLPEELVVGATTVVGVVLDGVMTEPAGLTPARRKRSSRTSRSKGALGLFGGRMLDLFLAHGMNWKRASGRCSAKGIATGFSSVCSIIAMAQKSKAPHNSSHRCNRTLLEDVSSDLDIRSVRKDLWRRPRPLSLCSSDSLCRGPLDPSARLPRRVRVN